MVGETVGTVGLKVVRRTPTGGREVATVVSRRNFVPLVEQ